MIELKHLTPYLPYELKAMDVRTKEIITVTWTHFTYDLTYVGMNYLLCDALIISEHKPILRPMSDLIGHKIAKEIFNDEGWLTGKSFKETVSYFAYSNNHLDFCFAQYDWEKFYENHFDVFGLIEKGLAIDVNTIEL